MKKQLISCLLIACAISVVTAQPVSLTNPTNSANTSMNFIKLNVISPLIKNYSLQYERVLSKSISLGISFRIMPETGLPFKNQIINLADITDPDEKYTIENLLISNYAITPEVRYYLGKKKYGNGLYLSLFYRYGSFNLNNVIVDWETEDEETTSVDISADVRAHTGGLMVGSQWALGKYMCLDWWIMGPHFGISSSDVLALSSETMDLEDQQNAKDDVDEILRDADIPMLKYSISTTSDIVNVKLDGPWGGLRFGLSFGVKF